MVPLAGQLVDSVHVYGPDGMLLVHGKVFGLAIELAGAREYDSDGGIVLAASLQDGELGGSVDIQIDPRLGHGIEMASLPSEVEQEVLALDQVGHGMRIP